jgi:hypothetical protein
MLLNCQSNYFFFYLDRVSYRSIFTGGSGLIVPTNAVDKYLPVTLNYVVDNEALK